MEKIIILSFVLLACVCLVCQGSVSVSPSSATATDASSSVAANATKPMPPMTSSVVRTKATDKPGTTKPTSGAVSVKSFAGLVFSFFVIALL